MPVLKIKLSQFENNIAHSSELFFRYRIEKDAKITEIERCQIFSNLMNLLYSCYNTKTFKISKPIRVDFYLDDIIIGSYLPKRYKKDLNNKYKNYYQFKIRETAYVLIEYIENHKGHMKQNKPVNINKKDSYMSLTRLINSKEFQQQVLPKFWRLEISTPMYS